MKAFRIESSFRNPRVVKAVVLVALAVIWLIVYAVRLLTSSFLPADIRHIGMLPTGVVDGLHLPSLFEYASTTYSTSGHLVYGVLLTPIYWLFGTRYLWTVLLGSMLVVAGLAFWAWAIRGAWGFACAALFLLFCIAPPPFFETRSHEYFWGTHLETVFFSGLSLVLFLRQDSGRPGFWTCAALAALSSIGIFFNVQNIPVVAALVVLTVWRFRWRGIWRILWPSTLVFYFCMYRYLNTFNELRLPSEARAPAPDVIVKLHNLFFSQLPYFLGISSLSLGEAARKLHAPSAIFRWCATIDEKTDFAEFGFLAVLAAVGLLLAAFAASGAQSGIATRLHTGGVSLADPETHDGERPGNKIWLTRYVILLFAFWLGGYAVVKMEIFDADHDRCRYLLPLYPVLMAAACYALAFLRGPVKWLTALPFVVAGFGQLCVEATHTPLLPAEIWQELNAERGDNYAFFVASVRPRKWWNDPGGPMAAITALPRRWQEAAWIAYGATLPAKRIDEWRQDPDDPDIPAARRALIARGRGCAIGIRARREALYAGEDLPVQILEPATAQDPRLNKKQIKRTSLIC